MCIRDRLFSNAPRPHGIGRITAIVLGLLAVTFLAVVPAATVEAFATSLCSIFMAAALRLFSVAFAGQELGRTSRVSDDKLPIYTIICALYREANVVDNLVAIIPDYPPEKLDVKFVLEADDRDTRRALDELDLGPPFAIITAPPIGPRTKPKALNVALPFARGSFIVVFAAEDVPEPDQLRNAFTAADARLACLQASLTIDNLSLIHI